jgi:hypothetical protein
MTLETPALLFSATSLILLHTRIGFNDCHNCEKSQEHMTKRKTKVY